MLRLIFKPLLVIVTLGLLLVALLQVGGRILAAVLDDLQPTVNTLLADRGIRVSGLSGDWRLLNPVIRIDRLQLPAGRVSGVFVEVDAVESVLRGTLLLRRLRITDLGLNLEKPPGESWRLAGGAAPGEFDPWPLLRDSNQLEASGTLRFNRVGQGEARIRFEYLGINRGGEHRHALTLGSADGDCPAGDGCRMTVRLHSQEPLWPLRPPRAAVAIEAADFLVPRALLGVSPLRIAELDAGWRRVDDAATGNLALHAEQFDMPGDVTLATHLRGEMRGEPDRQWGSISDWRVEQGDRQWSMPEVRLAADSAGVVVWMPALDLARASELARYALGAVEPARRWLQALDLQGRASNLRGYVGFDGQGIGYAMALQDVSMEPYKGSPMIRDGAGELIGFGRGLQFTVNAPDMTLALPDLFTGEWHLPYAQGAVQAWFGADYFGIRGLNLRAETMGTRAAGGFAMTRPVDREGQRLTLLVNADQLDVDVAKQFVPYKLGDDLRDWLATAPRQGLLENATLAYHGQFSEEPGELGRRLELRASIRDAEVRYDPKWPLITNLSGNLSVAGTTVEVGIDKGMTGAARLNRSMVRVVAGAADVSLDADVAAADMLTLIRTTPLAGWLSFVEPDWQASGALRLSGELTVPLGDGADRQTPLPAVRLRADLEGVDVVLPGYRIDLADLSGNLRYRYPTQIDASGVSGRLFGEPAIIDARTESDGDTVHLRLSGTAAAADAWRLAALEDPGVTEGRFPFEADLGIGVAEGVATELVVTSDLDGLQVSLPAGLGKTAEQVRSSEMRLVFGAEQSQIDFSYGDAGGWLQFADAPLRGAVGFGIPAPLPSLSNDDLLLSGRLAAVTLADVLPAAAAADNARRASDTGSPGAAFSTGDDGPLPLPIRFAGLQIDELAIGDFALTAVDVNGAVANDEVALSVASDQLEGRIEQAEGRPFQVRLGFLRVPADDDAAGDAGEPAAGDTTERADPLSVDLIGEIPAVDVIIDKLYLGEEDYGRWLFGLRPRDGDLHVEGLMAEVRGVSIAGTEPLVWRGRTNRTRFVGTLDGGNLAEVLPQWGYAANVETESAVLTGRFSWPGSPAAVELLKLRGRAQADAKDGRFLDMEAGAGSQRIFSLLNFTNIAKRLSLNFSDVFGRGVSFDEIGADFSLDEGRLTFEQPMEVKGTGSRFRVSGTVDMAAGTLDNEMVVTLPVSQSLPWYAAYVALANPLAGLGVLVGERMLRKPLEQVSSARYHIGGTLENPEVKFVSVFDTAGPSEAPAAAEDPSLDPDESSGPAPAAGADEAPRENADDLSAQEPGPAAADDSGDSADDSSGTADDAGGTAGGNADQAAGESTGTAAAEQQQEFQQTP